MQNPGEARFRYGASSRNRVWVKQISPNGRAILQIATVSTVATREPTPASHGGDVHDGRSLGTAVGRGCWAWGSFESGFEGTVSICRRCRLISRGCRPRGAYPGESGPVAYNIGGPLRVFQRKIQCSRPGFEKFPHDSKGADTTLHHAQPSTIAID